MNCLELLGAIPSRRQNVKQCQLVLSSLLKDIQNRKVSAHGFVANVRSDLVPQHKARNSQGTSEPGRKRRRTVDASHDIKLEGDRRHSGQIPPPALDHAMPQHDSSSSTAHSLQEAAQHHVSFSQSPSSANSAPLPAGLSTWPNNPSESPTATQRQHAGSAFVEPSTFVYPPIDNILPNFSLEGSDPSQWSNFDFNMADVFESATWENLIGSTEPDVSQWNFQT